MKQQAFLRFIKYTSGSGLALALFCAGVSCANATEVKVMPTTPASLKVQVSAGDIQSSKGKAIHVVAAKLQFDGPAIELFRARDASLSIPAAPANYEPNFEKLVAWPGTIRLTPSKDNTGTHILGNFFRTFRDETLTVKTEIGFKPYERDVDFVYMPEWGLIANKEGRMSGNILASAEGALQRLDLIQVGHDGKPTVKKGQSTWLCPVLPEADPGCVALAGIYIAPWRAARNPFYDNDPKTVENTTEYAITQHEICLIKNSSPIAPIYPQAIAKTLKKLRAGKTIKIAFLGDSITLGAESNKWWQPEPYTAKDMTYRGRVVYELRRRYPTATIEIIEAYQGGVPVSYGTAQMEKTVAPQKPDLIIAAFGANDVNSDIGGEPTTSVADFGAALAGIVEKAKGWGGEVLLVSPFPIHPWLKNGAAQRMPGHITELKKTAKEHGAGVADVYAEFSRLVDRGIPPWSQNHNWTNHPSDLGHKVYADTILRFFDPENKRTSMKPAPSAGKGSELLAQTSPVQGDWDLTPQPFPALQTIIDQPAPNLPVYGVYCWAEEYVRFHDFIRKVGWTTLRLGGKVDDAAVRLMAQDNMEVMRCLGDIIRPDETEDVFVKRYTEMVEKELMRYGPGGSFFKENSEVPNHPFSQIEIFNEPNFFYIDGKRTFKDEDDRLSTESHRTELYGKLLVASYKAIKSQWPDVKVVGFSAGGAAHADIRFIRDTHAKNAEVAASYDILSTHPYVNAPPEGNPIAPWGRFSIATGLEQIRKEMESVGNGNKPVWYTELNWEIFAKEGGRYPDADHNGGNKLTSNFQAANLVRGYALALRLGVPRLTYMSLIDTDHCNSGFLNMDGTWRPSAHAIATMIRVMPRPKLTGAIEDGKGNTYIYRFNPDYKTQGQEMLMAWCVSVPRIIEISWDKESVEIVDMLGNSEVKKVKNGKVPVEIGPFPIYLRQPQKP